MFSVGVPTSSVQYRSIGILTTQNIKYSSEFTENTGHLPYDQGYSDAKHSESTKLFLVAQRYTFAHEEFNVKIVF